MAKTAAGGNRRGRRASFGSVRRLPSGMFQARYTGPDGEHYRAPTTFQTKSDAETWLSLTRSDIIREKWLPTDVPSKRTPPMTFEQFAAEWLKHRQLKPSTRSHYRQMLDRYVLPTFGSSAIAAITRTEVREWYANFGDRIPTMKSHCYGLLRTILNSAVADEVIAVNPAYIRGAANTARVKEPRPASLEELAALIGALPERYRLMALTAAWCALRFGELAELRVKDVDLDEGVIRIRRGVTRVDGQVVIGSPKSKAGIRDVAIPPHLVPAFADHIGAIRGGTPESLLFPGTDGLTTMNSSALHQVFYTARNAAGRPDLRFHDLRHTGAVLAAQTGATLAELMGRLGHSTPGAAMRYQHVAQGRDRKIAAALSAMATTHEGLEPTGRPA